MISEKRRQIFEDTVRERMPDLSDDEVSRQVANMAYLDIVFREATVRIMGDGYAKIRITPDVFGPASYVVTFRRTTVESQIWDCHHAVSAKEIRARIATRPVDGEVAVMLRTMLQILPEEKA